MGYKIMKIICFFDLPTTTEQERREYRNFRKKLLSNGFIMIQYSVYVRTCPNREYSKKFIPKLMELSPHIGDIRMLTVTEKQYNDIIYIAGRKTKQEEVVADNKLVII